MSGSDELLAGQTFRTVDCGVAAGLTRGQLQHFQNKLKEGIAQCPTGFRTTMDDLVTSGGGDAREHVPPGHAVVSKVVEAWDRCSFERLAMFCGCVALYRACAQYIEDGWVKYLFCEASFKSPDARPSFGFDAYVRRLFAGHEPFLLLEERKPSQASAVPFYCILGDDPNIAVGSFANLGPAGGETLHFVPFRSFVEPAVARLRKKYRDLPQVPKRNVACDRHKMELTAAEYELVSLVRSNRHLQGRAGEAPVHVHVDGGGAISKLEYRERHTYHARNVPKFESDPCVHSILKGRDKTGGFGNIILQKEKTFG